MQGVCVLSLLLLLLQVKADLSRSQIQKAARAARASVDSNYEYSRRESVSRVRSDVFSASDVLRLMKQPLGATREAVRCADYMHNTLSYLQGAHRRHKRAAANSTGLSEQDFAAVLAESGCSRLLSVPSCSGIQNLYRYRTATSVCNNLENPRWGAANTAFIRLLPAEYQDGVSEPKGWDQDQEVNHYRLPLVREVSNHILSTKNEVDSDHLNSMMLTYFGQWIDHDVTFTPHSPVIRPFGSTTTCDKTCERTEPCFPIQVPSGDPRMPVGGCMPFIRSAPVCSETHVREQLNALTAFLDVGQVYGSDGSKARFLRDFSIDKGLLRVNQEYTDNGRELLPFNTGPNMCATRKKMTGDPEAEDVPCFVAGDERVNENIALTSLHTLMLREHNRLARALSELNPHWDGEKLYQEARKILGAVSQVITFRDYLPLVVGPDIMAQNLSLYQGYDSSIDASLSNVFATAAYRFAHLMVQPVMARLDEEYQEHPTYPSPLLHKTLFAPWRVIFEGGVDPIMRGIVGTEAKLNSQKHMLPDELREKLFKFTEALALDLGALNMQRGRDHGLPGYNAWRGYCGLSKPQNVEELGKVLENEELAKKLLDLYKTPDNIDVWLAGVAEPLVSGGKVGPLFGCLIAEQFHRIREGDRLWWENQEVFTEQQKVSIRDASMARIICDNTGISEVPKQPFRYRDRGYGYTQCEEIQELDLSPWREDYEYGYGEQGLRGPPGPQGPPGPPGPSPRIAFAVRLGNNFPKKHQVIKFRKEEYNEQNAYDMESGRFICKVAGVYEFHMVLVISSGVGVDMMRNGDNLLHSFNTVHGDTIMASGSTITRLKVGDQVYLVMNGDSTNMMLKDSQFSGHLLFADRPHAVVEPKSYVKL